MFLSYFLWSVLLTSLTVLKLPDSFQRRSTFKSKNNGPEQRSVSRFGFVPAEVRGHLKKELGQAVLLTSLLSGGILKSLQSGVSLTGQEAELGSRCPPGFRGDVQLLVAGQQEGSQGAGGASHPGVVRHAASRRGAWCGTGGVVRGGRAGVGVGTGVAPLPAGGGGSG